MKKFAVFVALLTGLFAIPSVSFAAAAMEESKPMAKEKDSMKMEPKTITGEGKCAKCMLHETKECQNAIEVMEMGKTVVYYVTPNEVSKKFHKNVCEESAKVMATGTVEMKDGKHMITVSKIDVAK